MPAPQQPCRVVPHPLIRGQWAIFDQADHGYWRSALTGVIIGSIDRAYLQAVASDLNQARARARLKERFPHLLTPPVDDTQPDVKPRLA